MEMKQMMEKLGAPQTHVGLKAMIAEIDEDNDGKVSFREVSAANNFFRDLHKILEDFWNFNNFYCGLWRIFD